MIYITGDTHGQFERIEAFCRRQNTRREDVLIILGDAGINYDGWVRDRVKKYFLEALPITLFCIHGNHEQRPQTLDTYRERRWHGGVVYYEEEYPDLLFAKDGEIFELDGWQTMVIGGAYSVDKMFRIAYGYGWWPDEQPSEEKADGEDADLGILKEIQRMKDETPSDDDKEDAELIEKIKKLLDEFN